MNPEIEDPLESSLDILVQNACLIVKPDQKALELEKGLFRNLTLLRQHLALQLINHGKFLIPEQIKYRYMIGQRFLKNHKLF